MEWVLIIIMAATWNSPPVQVAFATYDLCATAAAKLNAAGTGVHRVYCFKTK